MNTQYLSPKQVADKYNVSISTVHEWFGKRELPHIKINGVIRVKAKDLETFEDKHYVRVSRSVRRSPF